MWFKRPDLAAVEATIHHSQRKLDNAQKNEGDVVKSRDEVKQRLQTTQTELESVERIAAEAQGKFPLRANPSMLNICL